MEVAIHDPNRVSGSKDNSPDLRKEVNGAVGVDGGGGETDRIEEAQYQARARWSDGEKGRVVAATNREW